MSTTVKVWDLPTRLFHWSLVACVAGMFITAQIGGDAMVWHFRCGYSILSLLLFRLIWGVVGGKWSRFSSFSYGPSSLRRYLQGQREPEHSIGHNPLGAWSVFAMLVILLLQVASGGLSEDEIAFAGPLVKFASNALVGSATFYHKSVGKLLLLALLVLHISAIAFYYFKKRENLVDAMVGGNKQCLVEVAGSRDDALSRSQAAILFIACAALVSLLVQLAG